MVVVVVREVTTLVLRVLVRVVRVAAAMVHKQTV
jgi:hypothetical protein